MIRAPWDADVVKGLNAWQASGHVHPFTCGTDGCRTTLRATEAGWECPTGCGYTQDWAHEFMSAGAAPYPAARLPDRRPSKEAAA